MKKYEIYIPKMFSKCSMLATFLAVSTALVTIPINASAEGGHCHWDQSRHAEFMEKRQNKLHDKLALSASQESSWKDLVAQYKWRESYSKPEWAELSKLSTPDRLDRILTMKREQLQAMESQVKTVKSFYSQLTSDQKKVFDEFFAHIRQGHEHEWHHKQD